MRGGASSNRHVGLKEQMSDNSDDRFTDVVIGSNDFACPIHPLEGC